MAKKAERYLAIETSSSQLSMALGDDQKIVRVYRSPLAWRHAETLFAALERLLKGARWKPEQLSGVAVSIGPGSFTGIRIGLAVARTLGQALRIPVVGVSSLETMAAGVPPPKRQPRRVTPEINAFSGKLFAALFEITPAGDCRRIVEEMLTTPDEWKRRLKSTTPSAKRVVDNPDATVLLRLARPMLRKASVESYRKVLPLYLRRPAAQERLVKS